MNLAMSSLVKENRCMLHISIAAAASGIQINLYVRFTGQADFESFVVLQVPLLGLEQPPASWMLWR